MAALLLTISMAAACQPEDAGQQESPSETLPEDVAAAAEAGAQPVEAEAGEPRLANLQMLTFAGENA